MGVKMTRTILIFLVCASMASCASTKKKSTEDVETTDPPGPAILAIEIVDGNENSTTLRNTTKRTIESALGYGFQGNYYPTAKKYMVYPYSQHDIPASRNNKHNVLASQSLNIQKSVSYNLGTKIEPTIMKDLFTPSVTQSPAYSSQVYYPSTLYSTVGQGGAIGGLSTHFPSSHHSQQQQQQQQQHSPSATVPVIILRVYSNQLTDPAIYPNLPQSHPYANNLNSVNLQSILSNYIQQQMYQSQQLYQQTPTVSYPTHQSQNLLYQGAQDNTGYSYFHQPQPVYHQNQQTIYKSAGAASLPTHENYPSDSHTRVIYHSPKGHIQTANSYNNINTQSKTANSYNNVNIPSQNYQSYETPKQSYYPNSQQVYTDSNGQSYIYVDPSQLQNQDYYQQQQEYQPQDYQTQDYQPEDYPQQQQEYEQQQPQQEYQPQEDRKYLPVAQTPDKVYNYHADPTKERSKKSSGAPIMFESKRKETNVNNKS